LRTFWANFEGRGAEEAGEAFGNSGGQRPGERADTVGQNARPDF
jgi:hypothetical protein